MFGNSGSLDSCLHGCGQRHAITLEDHSRVTQTLAKRHKHPGQHVEQDLSLEQCRTSIGLSSWAPSSHTWAPCLCLRSPFQSPQYMAHSSTVCFFFSFVLKAAPRDSCDLSSPPSVSSKVAFSAVKKLVEEFAHVVCPHTFRENWSRKTRIVRGVNNCGRVALSSGVVVNVREKSSSDTTGIVTVTASSPPR